MTALGVVNIGALATGMLAAPRAEVESPLVEGGRIAAMGAASRTVAAAADVVIDCRPRTRWTGPRPCCHGSCTSGWTTSAWTSA